MAVGRSGMRSGVRVGLVGVLCQGVAQNEVVL